MSNAKRRHRRRRRDGMRHYLAIRREMGWQYDRALKWNRLIDRGMSVLHLFPPDQAEEWREKLTKMRVELP